MTLEARRTGWPAGLLQDDDRRLSRWLASRLDARQRVREACTAIAQSQPTFSQGKPPMDHPIAPDAEVTVDAAALHQVLQALAGPGREIRELQATRKLHALGFPNPIDILLEQSRLAGACRPLAQTQEPFQRRVLRWLSDCFGVEIASNRSERNHRFLEEALELSQSLGCTRDEADQLVAYVYGRPIGDPGQEVGGVMVTLAALCLAHGLDMNDAAEAELARISTPDMVEKIRAKQASAPKNSPLPAAAQRHLTEVGLD